MWPVSLVYAWAAQRRQTQVLPKRAPAPVVCVGNFTVGGGGKTPVVRALRAVLGPNAHVLSRGYGGRLEGPLRVTADMDALEVGDEPLLHAADGPAWIARDRVAGARAAAMAGARVVILDDGFQNPELAKDLSIIVVDAEYGLGNGRVFPAGPLRERLAHGLERADAVVLLRGSANDDAPAQKWLAGFDKPVLHAATATLSAPPAGKLVAFAGIARPEKFFDTLSAAGGDVVEAVPYEDHYTFTESDLDWLSRLGEERGANLVTTEKDYARLSPEWRARVKFLPVAVRFDDEAALEALMAPIAAQML
jgi:tetraacyldisaccharide 4'-kinase